MPTTPKANKSRPKATKPKRSCFVVSPIGDDGSSERRRADQVLRHIIEPATWKAGYGKPVRADQIASPGIITQQVIREVADADLVIADLSEHNPNVFYELALRHGLQRPLVQLIETGQRLPFDIAQMRTIKFDIHDLDSVEQAKVALAEQIEEIHSSEQPIVTPVSVARDMKAMWESEDPSQKILADVLAAISSLKADVQARGTSVRPSYSFPITSELTFSDSSAFVPSAEGFASLGESFLGASDNFKLLSDLKASRDPVESDPVAESSLRPRSKRARRSGTVKPDLR